MKKKVGKLYFVRFDIDFVAMYTFSKAQYIYWDSKLLAPFLYVVFFFLPGWSVAVLCMFLQPSGLVKSGSAK